MASTPIYNWPTPDNTDLVKNGALAIRTLGDAIDTTVDTMIPETIFAAKGDLLGASANDTPAVLTVGANGETLVADSSTSTGLRWQGDYAAGKNKIINGDFFINQRGFTSNTTSLTHNFDRWLQANGGTSGTFTVTPQTFTPGAAPVAGYESTNFLQGVTASGANSDTFAFFIQRIENVRTFAGQTATLSFWAKAASGTPQIALEIGQNFGTGGSPSSTVLTSVSAVTISSSWARYSITVNVPSISGKTIGTTPNTSYLFLNLWLSAGTDFNSRASSIGLQNNTFQLWGVQLEDGSVATAFQTATGTLQGELAACQRYYYRATANASNRYLGNIGSAISTTSVRMPWVVPVVMRNLISIDYSGIGLDDGVNATQAITSAGFIYAGPGSNVVGLSLGVASGLTQYRSYSIFGTTSGNYIGVSGEL